ncbi:MAG: PIN domain-containing protein [Pseudomonadales bacterium]
MPLRNLLDTDVLSDLVRAPQGPVAVAITAAGEDTVCTSIVVAGELHYGARRSGSPALRNRIKLILSALEVLPFETPADVHYARIRHDLTRRGTLIGPNDLLIAAHALALDLTLVTRNQREFGRIRGLRVEAW